MSARDALSALSRRAFLKLSGTAASVGVLASAGLTVSGCESEPLPDTGDTGEGEALEASSHARGYGSVGYGSHDRGYGSHARGYGSGARGYGSHARGYGSGARGYGSHARGYGSGARGYGGLPGGNGE